jgi:hypothetical protein
MTRPLSQLNGAQPYELTTSPLSWLIEIPIEISSLRRRCEAQLIPAVGYGLLRVKSCSACASNGQSRSRDRSVATKTGMRNR